MNPLTDFDAALGAASTSAVLPKDVGTLTTSGLQELAAAAAEDLARTQDGESKERYLAVLSALENRPDPSRGRERALKPQQVTPQNTTVYNNHLHGRYELFVDGTLAAYLKYEMHNGDLWALRVTVDPDYRRKKVHTLLIEEVLADSLRRRVPLLPFCPETRAYLAGKRQYHKLVPREHWSRFTVRLPAKARRRRAAPTAGTGPAAPGKGAQNPGH